MTARRAATAAALGAAALVLYAIGLEHTPAYLHDAEVLFGLQSHAIATTAHDVNGRLLPLYFQMRPIGDNVWFHPVIVYVTAAFLKVLPFAEWSVRLPSAAVGAANVVLIYLVGLRMFARERHAVAAALLLLLTPAHFIHSRIAMDYIYPLPFVLGWMLALSWFLERRRPWMLFAATSILGVGVYSYIASVIMMPIYVAMTLVVVWWTERGRARLGNGAYAGERDTPGRVETGATRAAQASSAARIHADTDRDEDAFGRTAHAPVHHTTGTPFPLRPSALAIAGFVWPLMAIPLWLWSHPLVVAETLSRYHIGATPTRYSGVAGRLSMFWYFHDPTYLFLTGGYANVVNSTRHAGVFALPLIVLLPAGVYAIVARRRSSADDRRDRRGRYPTFFTGEATYGGSESRLTEAATPSGAAEAASDARPTLADRHPSDLAASDRSGVDEPGSPPHVVRSTMRALALAGFLTAPVAACLAVPEPYAVDRELTVVVFGVLVAVCGLELLARSGAIARRVATGALVLVPLHFLFFSYDYFTDYRRRSAIWFELNHRGAFEAVLAREAQGSAPRIYLPGDKDPYMASYWRFTLTKHGRVDLEAKTELYANAALAAASLAPGSLVIARLSDPVPATLMAAGLRLVATVPEVGDPPEFVVLER